MFPITKRRINLDFDLKKSYKIFLGINPKFTIYKLGPFVAVMGFKGALDIGFQRMYGVVYNPVSTKLNLALGGKIIATRRYE